LRLAVLKSLSPLRVARSHSEDAMAQIQGPAPLIEASPAKAPPVSPPVSICSAETQGTPGAVEPAAAAAAPTPLHDQNGAVGIEGLAP
jgi:hypothetical protein